MRRVGVLALQGDFEAHQKALQQAGAEAIPVRTSEQLEQVEGLIIPGGESTTMLKLLRVENLLEPLKRFAEVKPVFGTCAGAILLASKVTNPVQESLNVVDIDVERNAYGRQLDSRVARIDAAPGFVRSGGASEDFEAVFIRAPVIRRVGEGVKVLARFQGDPVLVEQGRHLVATFHPELTADRSLHKLFLRKLGPETHDSPKSEQHR
ncbi:MAG: pyridoxal 5'-phosphate synthase glutaminase subunit PdxT [Bryobacteraceae bacterium]|nr:pyridoxal 5'-phosphate synthase glutaminase subunit PdxT [Bryobacterales bacterium]MEB2362562.1 pyridoxal 5'-phosphate synthase glutaminase subunit PdxT [Bryobacterales bacterium]NUN01660.1 pyridoxal 5'-phosphate synthase glutaminase subunit PdxT [Bryobacteraceae bacterium]